jgi:hypothetical protein
MKFND